MKKEILKFAYSIKFPLFFLILLWTIRTIDVLLDLRLSVLGIYPREWTGILGIFTSPLIHSNWGHLASNSLPIISLMTILVIFYKRAASKAFKMIWLGTGFLVWLFGRPSFHIGASGLVYGLIGFIFFTGIFKSNIKSIVLSLIVLTLYSGSVESMFPNAENNVSWESHLFGAMVGLVTAFVLRSVIEEDEKIYNQPPSWVNEVQEKQYFLPRDVFEKTKLQRYYENLERERLKIDLDQKNGEIPLM